MFKLQEEGRDARMTATMAAMMMKILTWMMCSRLHNKPPADELRERNRSFSLVPMMMTILKSPPLKVIV